MEKNICEFLESQEGFFHANPVPIERIREAEKKLNLKFADDYVECLLKYGAISVDDIEIYTIVSNDFYKYHSIIYKTTYLKELEDGYLIPDDMYAISSYDYGEFQVWQDRSGTVYISEPFTPPVKVADSLMDYIEKALNDELFDNIEENLVDESGDINEDSTESYILNLIGELDDFFYLDKPDEAEIEFAERELGLKFADEYKRYVSIAGAICGGGLELTGITDFERLNVVSVTRKAKRMYPLINDNMYVVEVVGIDGMIILQDSTGTIYTAQPNVAPKKFFDSLVEYIENAGRFCPNENARTGFYFEQRDEFGQDLVQRMENGIIPIGSDGELYHLHHMGLANGMPITTSPLVEFRQEKYYDQGTINTLFNGFECNENYDRLECIKQKQNHWNIRSEDF